VPFSALFKTFGLQRSVHERNSAPSASSPFILLSLSEWVSQNGLIPHSRKESQTAETREDAERLKYSLEDPCFESIGRKSSAVSAYSAVDIFFFISEGPKYFYNFLSNKKG
jgi:hypothetical protein